MGGHGGLNILPQKKWNVYNFENREKVRKDEEAAAREEQLKREDSRRRDTEFRVEKLRQARGLATESNRQPSSSNPSSSPSHPADSNHINLFEGIEDFSSLGGGGNGVEKEVKKDDGSRDGRKEERSGKRKREERPVVVTPEDEKYRMGYGLVGKGVKAPWYLSRPGLLEENGDEDSRGCGGEEKRKEKKTALVKKTIEELREERVKREKREKERERALVASAGRQRHGGTSFNDHKIRRSRYS